MESTITTPRLKLTLVTTVDRNSEVFKSIHELRSNEQSAWWSLYGPAKSPSDTEKSLQTLLSPTHPDTEDCKDKKYGIAYAVYTTQPSTTSANPTTNSDSTAPSFIGLISLRSLTRTECLTPPHSTHASTPSTLSLELAYMFLPTSWGKGYATESIQALFGACARAEEGYWDRERVWVRAIVHDENAGSQRVMEKCMLGEGEGVEGRKGEMEILDFEGGRFFIAGKWRVRHRLFVYGAEVVG